MGATPARLAKAASLRHRPGWDQAHKTVAATMGPMPSWSSRSGRQDRTIDRIACSWSRASTLLSATAQHDHRANVSFTVRRREF